MCGREKQEAAVFQSPGAWRVNERPLPASRLLAAPAGRSNFSPVHGGQLADLPGRKFLPRARAGARVTDALLRRGYSLPRVRGRRGKRGRKKMRRARFYEDIHASSSAPPASQFLAQRCLFRTLSRLRPFITALLSSLHHLPFRCVHIMLLHTCRVYA